MVLALIGTLSVLFAYLIGRRLSGPPAGLIGAGAVAIYPAFLEYQGMLMSEPLAAALLSAAVLAMLWAADAARRPISRGRREQGGSKTPAQHAGPSPGRKTRAPDGSSRGCSSAPRRWSGPSIWRSSSCVALVVFARTGRQEWRRSLVQAALLLAGAVIVVAPWTVRNAFALGRFVPLSTGGGQVLFSGTYLPSGGRPAEGGPGGS